MRVSSKSWFEAYRAKYDYCVGLRQRDWAWEYLRRNPDFQAEAYPALSNAVSRRPGTAQISLLKLRTPQPRAEAWGLKFFPDPDATALTASVFWTGVAYPGQLAISVTPRDPSVADKLFERTLSACRVQHLTDCDGSEHLLLQGRGCTAQVQARGLSMLSGQPVQMTLSVNEPYDISRGIDTLTRSEAIFDQTPWADRDWTERVRRLRNGLICLDTKSAGLELRYAAEIIYGEARVKREWSSSKALRDRVRSFLRSGQRIRDGGYRALLNPKRGRD